MQKALKMQSYSKLNNDLEKNFELKYTDSRM